MENNEAFEAEVEAETLNLARHQQRPVSTAPDAFLATSVGASGREHGENDPLLGHRKVRSSDDDSQSSTCSSDKDFEGVPWYRTPSIWWLLPSFALFTMAFGATIVLKINVILSLVCRQYYCERAIDDPTFHMLPVMTGADNPQCQTPEVQSAVTKFMLYGSLISGILSAIVSPKLGKLSDQYGRTKVIAYTTCGMIMCETAFILVATYPDMLSVNWILVGFVFDGLGGSFIAAMAVSYAYAADCTPVGRRNVIFGWYQGCLFGGIALGPIFGGTVVKATGNILSVFYFALAAHFIFFSSLLLVVPESLPKARQLAARAKADFHRPEEGVSHTSFQQITTAVKRLFRETNFFAPLAILWPTEPGTNPALRRNLFFLAAVDTTMFGVAMGAMTVILLYSEYSFGWGNFETNVFLTVVNTCRVTVLLVVLPLLTRLLRGPPSKDRQKASGCDQIDLGIIRFGILFDILGYVGYTTVRTGELFIVSGALASLGGMVSPTLQSALTKHVPPDRTGQVLGALGLLHAAARVVSPLIFNLIYAETVGKFAQTVFVCLAATFGLAFVFAWCVKPNVYWEDPYEETVQDSNGQSDGALERQDDD
ncbi:uncharacterized protein KY384_000540 [Bacidia gigantensis]|uniref:uncharacterized protein n=1 Tax=Bacidia gigantensis TaxID=2732470 RepID=UPI001D0521ED|nr:uncharacterized protein KY384_000540 [Bacidia gigantensis]KAG8525780.1 hypothetical protein KY384_000540 [Bacidia gigantensis]